MTTTTMTTTSSSGYELAKSSEIGSQSWLRGLDLNQRPSGYENYVAKAGFAINSSIAAFSRRKTEKIICRFVPCRHHTNNYIGDVVSFLFCNVWLGVALVGSPILIGLGAAGILAGETRGPAA